MEKSQPDSIADEDIEFIAFVVAKIAERLQKVRREYHTPQEYGANVLRLLEHKKNLAAGFVLFDFKNMDSGALYNPSHLRKKYTEHMKSDKPKVDTADMTTSLVGELESDYHISPTDMSRALKLLDKDVGLINVQGKQEINRLLKEKIHFTGSPSIYMLPDRSRQLKTVLSKPKAMEHIINALKMVGLVDHLEFLFEASFYAMRDDPKEKMYDLTKVAQRDLKIDKVAMESFTIPLKSIDEGQLKILAQRLVAETIQNPDSYRFLLLVALFNTP